MDAVDILSPSLQPILESCFASVGVLQLCLVFQKEEQSLALHI